MKEETITASETTSKNIFEKYLQLIEQIRLRVKIEKQISSLNFLETVIMTTERALQDISHNSMNKANIKELNEKTNEFLLEHYDLFEFYNSESVIIDAISYNIMALVTIILNISDSDYDYYLRHIFKLYLPRKVVNKISSNKNNSNIGLSTRQELKIILAKYLKLNRNSSSSTFNHVEPEDLSSEEDLIPILQTNLLLRLYEDYFKFGDLSHFKSLEIEDVKATLSKHNLNKEIELLFQLNLEEGFFEWDINIKLSNESGEYNAKNISYLIFALSSALESIGDIDVQIDDWGNGSKWIKLKLKIRDTVSKLDLIDVLNKVRQQSEGIALGKTYGEVKKIEAEAEKINEETNKVKKEIENLPSASITAQMNELELVSKKMDVQKKYFELESQMEDLKTKKLSNVLKASQLINEGLIANDGRIQMYINECLYIDMNNNIFDKTGLKKLDEIEGKEEKIKEGDSSTSPDIVL